MEIVQERSCSCGKKNGEIDNCLICLEYRTKQLPQTDSFILSALKMHIVEAFFHQQYYSSPGGGSVQYGGQMSELVRHLLDNKDFKAMDEEITNHILSRKDEWIETAVNTFKSRLEYRAAELVNSYDIHDKMYAATREVAAELMKEIVRNDEKLKERIQKIVTTSDYTVTFDVRVNVIENKVTISNNS